MVVREKVTMGVLAVLLGALGWFALTISRQGLGTDAVWQMGVITIGVVVFSAIVAAVLIAGSARHRQVDERDGKVAMRSQGIRGFLYLGLSFLVLGVSVGEGNYAIANAMFLAILGIEIVSGLIMLVLYRASA